MFGYLEIISYLCSVIQKGSRRLLWVAEKYKISLKTTQTQKKIMIDYSLTMKGNPSDPAAAKRAYAQVQIKETYDLDKLSKHIAMHGSVWTEDIVAGVVKKFCKCVEELIIGGCKVELGDLGAFYPAVSSIGARTYEDFNPANNIKKVRANFSRGEKFKNLRNSDLPVEFNLVLTRNEQAKAKKEVYK